MKKQVFALTLFCCCLIGFAKDKNPINYRFHKNDTINLLKEEVDEEGKKTSSKLQVVVIEANGTKALLEFKSIIDDTAELDSSLNNSKLNFIADKEKFKEEIMSKTISPIILYENGKAKSVFNFEEVKTSMTEVLNTCLNEISENPEAALDMPKEKADSAMIIIKRFIMPLFETFMTEETIMSGYSTIVLSGLPQKLGEDKVTDKHATMRVSLSATENEGEYAFQRTIKAQYSADDLNDPSLKESNPMIFSLTSKLGALGTLLAAFIDSINVDVIEGGVVFANGIPKQLVHEKKITISAMGKNKERIEKVTISVIDK